MLWGKAWGTALGTVMLCCHSGYSVSLFSGCHCLLHHEAECMYTLTGASVYFDMYGFNWLANSSCRCRTNLPFATDAALQREETRLKKLFGWPASLLRPRNFPRSGQWQCYQFNLAFHSPWYRLDVTWNPPKPCRMASSLLKHLKRSVRFSLALVPSSVLTVAEHQNKSRSCIDVFKPTWFILYIKVEFKHVEIISPMCITNDMFTVFTYFLWAQDFIACSSFPSELCERTLAEPWRVTPRSRRSQNRNLRWSPLVTDVARDHSASWAFQKP